VSTLGTRAVDVTFDSLNRAVYAGKSKDWQSWCSSDFIERDRLELGYLEELGKAKKKR
jgi:hypothetical protein